MDLELAFLSPTKPMTYEAKSTGIKSLRRRRTEREAIATLDGSKLRGLRRKHALMRIRLAKQPIAEVRRIVAQFTRDAAAGNVDVDFIDADAQLDRLHDHRSGRSLTPKQMAAYKSLLDRICAGSISDRELDALLEKIY